MTMRRTLLLILTALLTGASCTPGDSGGDQNPDGNSGGDNNPPTALAEPPAFRLDDSLIPTPALAGKPVLNEIFYLPQEGQTAFIELKGAAAADLAAGLFLRNEKNEVLAVPAALMPADANGIITIFLDGLSEVTGDTAHAGSADFLNPDSGFVKLEDAVGAELDRVSWGADRADAVRMHGTGLIAMPSGLGCCRRPQSVEPGATAEWFIASPIDPTPGKPNRNLGARMLFPFDGALVTTDDLSVDWEFVRNAVQYELQVATDSAFASMVINEVVPDGPVELTLPAGGYYWRVQAAFADGSLADWSPIKRLIVVESIDEDAVPPDDASTAKSIVTLQGAPTRKKLSRPVPMYFQRKDSHMLLLESDGPSGTSHAWDAPHARLDKGDPADRTNCALAAISMVNAYFANRSANDSPYLTQDRIGFHIHTSSIHPDSTNYPGPEFDLNFDSGNEPRFYQAGLDFALGMEIPSAYRGFSGPQALFKFVGGYPKEFREQFWKDLGIAIAADKPVPFAVYNGQTTFESHAMVARLRLVVGGVRYVQVNDPWEGIRYYPLDDMLVFEYWMIPDGVTPRADEDELRNRTDSDKDGIMDFDERMRFGTRWERDDDRDRDTDQDCVDDLAEVRNSVLDTKHGWGQYWTKLQKGLEVNSDGAARRGGKRPEKEGSGEGTDSDGAGLPDPMEDLNGNGKHDEDLGETNIFDSSDDHRTIKGFKEIFEDSLDPQTRVHSEIKQREEYDLQVAGGEIKGTVNVTRNYKTTQDFDAVPGAGTPECSVARTRTSTMRELKYTRDVKARFFCQVLRIEVDPYIPLPDQPVDIIDQCWYPGSVGAGSMQVYPTIGMTTEKPSSTDGGTVTYTHSTTKTENLGRTGTFRTEWDIKIEK